MMKKLSTVVAPGLSALSFNAAFAHGGDKAKHGEAVAMAGDLGFELVATPGGAAMHAGDHGKPMAPTGMT